MASRANQLERLSRVRAQLATRFGKPTRSDAIAGVTSGIAAIPDGMTSGVIAGINPVYGLYTLMVNTPISALALSTQLMVVNTTSAMILVASDGLGDLSGPERVQAMMGIALVAGVFQVILGVLGLGSLTRFISNAVMTGLLTGVAVLIILGQLWDFFGYSGEGDSKLSRAVNLLGHLSEIDPVTTMIGVLTVIIMIGLGYTRFARVNLIVALAAATFTGWILKSDSLALVSSLGEIPRGLPSLHIPGLRETFDMVLAGIAVGLRGCSRLQAWPNAIQTRISDPNDSQDFMAQGIGNVVGSMFQAMPAGGSLSSTALGVSAGAQTRWASVFTSVVVIVMVLLFANLLSIIPIAALAALLIYSATLSIKIPLIKAVSDTGIRSATAMWLTLIAALVVPIQQAIILGVIVAATIFVYRASKDIRVVRLRRRDGLYYEEPPPTVLDSDDVVLLDVYGSLFYAGARTLSEMLPSVGSASNTVVILRLRGTGDIGSTLMNVLNGYANELRSNGGELMLSGIDPLVKKRLIKSNQIQVIGAENVFESTNMRHQSIGLAEEAARNRQDGIGDA
ncbi:MAG: SulP family inorganic anion transporter [Thermomicrobiales bacterium]|nr:SulP family inorganic anion transporter [Thermomicrobiales bacterium]